MDLPTCPSCGQSVLDDDVDECPFCGASMSSGPASRGKAAPAPAAKTSPKPPPSAPAAGGRAKPSPGERLATAPTKTKPDRAADPISAEKAAAPSKVIPLRPKPSKGRTHKVVCPMCETPGYTARKAAGRDVKCVNPDCPLPVFTAPELPEEPPEPETSEEPRKPFLSRGGAIALAACGAAFLAFGVWYLFLRPKPVNVIPPPGSGYVPQSAQNQPGGTDTQNGGTNGEKPGPKKDGPDQKQPAAPTIAELQNRVLDLIDNLAADNSRSFTKPQRRVLSTLSHIRLGRLEEAREQLTKLRVVSQGGESFLVLPLAKLAQRQLAASERDAAGKSAESALNAAEALLGGRLRYASASELAASLVLIGRLQEARALVEKHNERLPEAQLAAVLQAADAFGTFDVESNDDMRLRPWSGPQWVATTLLLAARGDRDRARQWAEQAPQGGMRAECLISFADVLVRHGQASKQGALAETLTPVVASLPPADRARLLGRVAWRLQLAGDDKAAARFLGQARSALASVDVPEPMPVPGTKQLFTFRLPDSEPSARAALAAVEIARAQSAAGQSDAAWESLQRAMAYLRGATPSPAAAEELLTEVAENANAVRERLRRVLDLATNDEVTRRFRDYRRIVERLQEDAEARFELQSRLLAVAAGWDDAGLRDRIWQEIKDRALATDAAAREPWFRKAPPLVLRVTWLQAGDEAKVKEIDAAARESNQRPGRSEIAAVEARRLAAEGAVTKAAALLSVGPLHKAERTLTALKLIVRLVDGGNLDTARQFALALTDSEMRVDALGLLAARAAHNGQAREVHELIRTQNRLYPLDRVALCHGFIAGTTGRDR